MWCEDGIIVRERQQRTFATKSAKSGLKDVAELCPRDYAGRPGPNVRDQLLTIAIEWDLADDTLDRQSDACLRAVAVFLR